MLERTNRMSIRGKSENTRCTSVERQNTPACALKKRIEVRHIHPLRSLSSIHRSNERVLGCFSWGSRVESASDAKSWSSRHKRILETFESENTAHTDADSNCNADEHSDSNRDSDEHSDTDADRNTCDADSNANRNSGAIRHADTDQHASREHRNSDAYVDSHSDAGRGM